MIRRLRLKFVALSMSLVSVVLLCIFLAVNYSVQRSIEAISRQVLYQVIQDEGVGYFSDAERPDIAIFRGQERVLLPYFTVNVWPQNGIAYVTGGTYSNLEDTEVLQDILSACLRQEEDEGTIPSYGLRYLRQNNGAYEKIAFVDMSMEQATLQEIMGSYLQIGLAALLLLILRMCGTLGLLALAAQLADIILNLIDDLGQHNATVADGRVQLIDRVERELVERVLLHLFVLIKAVIQQVGTQLAVEILLAVDDIFLAAFLLEPLLDLVARLGGLDDLHPVTARTVCLLGGQDLNDIAVFQLTVDRCDTAVQLAAGHAVADCGVNCIRKVDRRCACRHIDHIALGRKDEYLVREQVNLDVFDKVLGLGVLLGFKQLTNPRECFLVALLIQTLLVLPVRRYTVFRHFMHLYGTNLHLKRDARSADDRRMQ